MTEKVCLCRLNDETFTETSFYVSECDDDNYILVSCADLTKLGYGFTELPLKETDFKLKINSLREQEEFEEYVEKAVEYIDLTDEEKQESLPETFIENKKLFDNKPTTSKRKLTVQIESSGEPKKCKAKPLCDEMLKNEHEVDDIEKRDFITEVKDAKWASPIGMVLKKDNT